jgi:hypothetical protein
MNGGTIGVWDGRGCGTGGRSTEMELDWMR